MGRDIETRVAVLGAGLQGCAIALELAARGHDVLLLERDARALNRASLRNEGKIHQGLIYAAEASGDTALVQLQGALLFRRLVARWIGAAAWSRVGISTPFTYLVARDSLLAAERLEAHYAFVEAHARQWGGDYLGRPLDTLARRVDAGVFPPPGYAGDGLSCAFATQELALDTEDLAREVRAAIASEPRIRFMPSCDVRQAVATAQGFDLACLHGGEPVSVRARQVVNATWDNRLWLDRQAGAAVREGWLHRLKYRVIVRLPDGCAHLPSATMVLGRYGDVVVRPDGTAYLSWYPAGLRGRTHDLRPPATWDAACSGGDVEPGIASEVVAEVARWFPAAARSQVLQVDAGAIFAYGESDVDRRASGLHARNLAGVAEGPPGWVSVDTGKLTTAPWFAVLAADRVLGTTTPGFEPWPRLAQLTA